MKSLILAAAPLPALADGGTACELAAADIPEGWTAGDEGYRGEACGVKKGEAEAWFRKADMAGMTGEEVDAELLAVAVPFFMKHGVHNGWDDEMDAIAGHLTYSFSPRLGKGAFCGWDAERGIVILAFGPREELERMPIVKKTLAEGERR